MPIERFPGSSEPEELSSEETERPATEEFPQEAEKWRERIKELGLPENASIGEVSRVERALEVGLPEEAREEEIKKVEGEIDKVKRRVGYAGELRLPKTASWEEVLEKEREKEAKRLHLLAEATWGEIEKRQATEKDPAYIPGVPSLRETPIFSESHASYQDIKGRQEFMKARRKELSEEIRKNLREKK